MYSSNADRIILDSFGSLSNIDDLSALFEGLLSNIELVDRLPFNAGTGRLKDELRHLLTSQAFQDEIIAKILNAYPEKKRLFYVHLPKCAGSDLIYHLSNRFPDIDIAIADPAWMSGLPFLHELRRVILALSCSEIIFVHGHLLLEWWVTRNLYRPKDCVFTVMRHPQDIVISRVNYVLRRLLEDPNAETPDTKHFLDLLNYTHRPELNEETIPSFCFEMLHNPHIVSPNVMCTFLGDGTYESALANLVACDVEVATVETYRRWTSQRWQINEHTRINESPKVFGLHQLHLEDTEYINSITKEDQLLFDRIRKLIWMSNRPSVRGHALA